MLLSMFFTWMPLRQFQGHVSPIDVILFIPTFMLDLCLCLNIWYQVMAAKASPWPGMWDLTHCACGFTPHWVSAQDHHPGWSCNGNCIRRMERLFNGKEPRSPGTRWGRAEDNRTGSQAGPWALGPQLPVAQHLSRAGTAPSARTLSAMFTACTRPCWVLPETRPLSLPTHHVDEAWHGREDQWPALYSLDYKIMTVWPWFSSWVPGSCHLPIKWKVGFCFTTPFLVLCTLYCYLLGRHTAMVGQRR